MRRLTCSRRGAVWDANWLVEVEPGRGMHAGPVPIQRRACPGGNPREPDAESTFEVRFETPAGGDARPALVVHDPADPDRVLGRLDRQSPSGSLVDFH